MINIAELHAFLSKKVRGQPRAVETLCSLIEDSQNLDVIEEREGPIGVMMAMGPSGVGKTEIARALALYLYGSKQAMTKISCGNLTQEHTVHMLTGAPPSYIGFGQSPLLGQESVNKKPKNIKAKKEDPELQKLLNARKKLAKELGKLFKELNRIFARWANLNSQISMIESSMMGVANVKEAVTRIDSLSGRQIINSPDRDTSEAELVRNVEGLMATLQDEVNRLMADYHRTKAEMDTIQGQIVKINERIGSVRSEPEASADAQNPPSIILFDEIEKANPSIHKLLLEIMEEGEVTLSDGSRSNLRNSLIILTSNIGARAMGDVLKNKKMGFAPPNPRKTASTNLDLEEAQLEILERRILEITERELNNSFSPEFRGRLDDVVVFRPLPRSVFAQILDDHIELFSGALKSRKGVELLVEGDVKALILEQIVHRPETGARLLNHKLKSVIKRPLGRLLDDRPQFHGTVRAYLADNGRVGFDLKDTSS